LIDAAVATPHALVSLFILIVVVAMMLAEQRYSLANERALRVRGAIEPPGDVYPVMRLTYPAAFVVMTLEGVLTGSPPVAWVIAGAVVFVAAKALKYWAIASLGARWTFRVLVPPDADATRVTSGPYKFLRHPNYVGVMGELVGMALLVGARVTGPLATFLFGLVLWQRIRVENSALRHPPCT
jgi:methyltransferase